MCFFSAVCLQRRFWVFIGKEWNPVLISVTFLFAKVKFSVYLGKQDLGCIRYFFTNLVRKKSHQWKLLELFLSTEIEWLFCLILGIDNYLIICLMAPRGYSIIIRIKHIARACQQKCWNCSWTKVIHEIY